MDKNWDPDKLHAPNQNKFFEPRFSPNNTSFGKGKEIIVNVDVNKFRIHYIHTAMLIGLGIDLPDTDNCKKLERAPLLAMDICACQTDPNKPIPR